MKKDVSQEALSVWFILVLAHHWVVCERTEVAEVANGNFGVDGMDKTGEIDRDDNNKSYESSPVDTPGVLVNAFILVEHRDV